MIKLTRMEWDSNFWGINIYNANKCYKTDYNKLDFHKELNNRPLIIQALVKDNDIEYINYLEDNGFRFIESKVNFVKRVQEATNTLEHEFFRNIKREDLNANANDFYNLFGQVSRFSFIDKEKVNDFYFKWIVESIKGNLDDYCIGYYSKEILEGFITFKITKQELVIGLLGIFPMYQGKKTSQKLLDYVTEKAYKNKCNRICVSTQGKNIKAINAYIRNGFLLDNINHWYYYKEE